MDIYLVDESNPHAISMAEKLSSTHVGIVKATRAEYIAYKDGAITKLPASQVSSSNPNLQVVPLLLEPPSNLTYLVIIRQGNVRRSDLLYLKNTLKDKCIILTTY